MITLLSTESGSAISYIDQQLVARGISRSIHVGDNAQLINNLRSCVSSSNIAIIVADTFLAKQIVSQALELPMFFDNNISSKIANYCSVIGRAKPPQYQLDALCQNVEGFLPISNTHGIECGLIGQYANCQLFILPLQRSQCAYFYDSIVSKSIDKLYSNTKLQYHKIYGLTNKQIIERIAPFMTNSCLSYNCSTDEYLDTILLINYANNATKSSVDNHSQQLEKVLGHYLYANSNVTLASVAVSLLKYMHKTVAIAESITGGLLANAFVEIAGASQVFLESAVTYATESKQSRLGLNANMIDVYGVVSSQVASEMATAVQKQSGADYSLSITGSAGPTSYEGVPVGLCFIGVGSYKKVKTYRTEHYGNRESIRKQATNSALFLLINTIKNIDIS